MEIEILKYSFFSIVQNLAKDLHRMQSSLIGSFCLKNMRILAPSQKFSRNIGGNVVY